MDSAHGMAGPIAGADAHRALLEPASAIFLNCGHPSLRRKLTRRMGSKDTLRDAMNRLLYFVTILFTAHQVAYAQQQISIPIGPRANGFHVPESFAGTRINARLPDGHEGEVISDLLGLVSAQRDVAVYQADNISNAFAIIFGQNDNARRMVVFDRVWTRISEGKYHAIFAHEVGHHICGHTMGQYQASPRATELEADRAAGALFRRAFDKNQSLGNFPIFQFEDMIASARKYLVGPGSKTHPPGDVRINAYIEGWNSGSSCLGTYVPFNPFRPKGVIEQIVDVHGETGRFFKADGSVVRADIDATEMQFNGLRLVFHTVGPLDARMGIRPGAVLFESTIDGGDKGALFHYSTRCPPLSDPDVEIKMSGFGNFWLSFKAIIWDGCYLAEPGGDKPGFPSVGRFFSRAN